MQNTYKKVNAKNVYAVDIPASKDREAFTLRLGEVPTSNLSEDTQQRLKGVKSVFVPLFSGKNTDGEEAFFVKLTSKE